MLPDTLLKQIDFIKEIDKLKYIQRRTKLFNSDVMRMMRNIAGIWL